ncbi:carbohydrate ABC transporter permease [Rhizobium hainanense]|uniref:Carbohydrate ABC transporter membrane protein 2, CUT1 family n=1 Tax=Rhizobium hainanense TaxID=52131 RepID=A0A1C3W8T7_9HYPH|nr:carbohydrate ABC transporter permease [Rhizobium hainanense]SCB36562.1 carbohydrate ABC transporter membrane protein 2, CUT1 family [Rhizobium hainanense]
MNNISRSPLRFLQHMLVLGLVAIMLLPVAYMLLMSFRNGQEIVNAPLALPKHWHFENYARAYENMSYLRSILNSLGITVAVTVAVSFIGALAAYPLSRSKSRGTQILISLLSLCLATPSFVTITPIYETFARVGLLDTYLGIILAFTALNLPLAVFFYTSFIRVIPQELEEAAELDGCSSFQVFWYIIRPLLGPATATLSLFVMLMVWNDFIYPLLLLTDDKKFTVMMSVYRFVGNQSLNPEELFPAAVLGSLPLLVLFLLFQRRIVNGITAGAVK